MVAPPEGQCKLFGGPAAWLAQALLGLIAIAALLYKRHREKPQRPWQIWGMDVSKQILSMLMAHVCGIAIASLLSRADSHEVSECAWYFVAFAFDTSLGLALAIGIHSLALKAARGRASNSSLAVAIADCGNYGTPLQWSRFWPQALEWTLAVVLARFVCGIVVFLFRGWLTHAAKLLDVIFDGSPIAMLYFVMICCPLAMNLCQAIIQDMALKWREKHADGQLPGATPDAGEADGLRLLPRGQQTS